MSHFFDSRCNGRQNGSREPQVLKKVPDGIPRGPTEDEALVNKKTQERRKERRRQAEREEKARNQRRVWASQVSSN